MKEQAGKMDALAQSGARLTKGRTYRLRINIGARNERIRTLGDALLMEEDFKWTPDMLGRWIEIGVIAVDFNVLGEAVQEFWLPRLGDSEPNSFAIVARKTGRRTMKLVVHVALTPNPWVEARPHLER